MKRLMDDPEIVGELRTELQRYASEQAQVDMKRAYAELEHSLQLKAALPGATSRGISSGYRALSSSTKLLIVAAIGGASVLGVNALRSPRQAPAIVQPTAPAPAIKSTASGAAASSEQQLAAAELPSSAALAQPTAAASTQPAGSAAHAQPAHSDARAQPIAARAPAPDSTPQKGRAAASSRREIAQLARIKALLETDPAAARRLIRAAQREFPAGLLVEEREGLDVIALFALGQNDRARTSAERFIARYPQSPLRPKLERLIADAHE